VLQSQVPCNDPFPYVSKNETARVTILRALRAKDDVYAAHAFDPVGFWTINRTPMRGGKELTICIPEKQALVFRSLVAHVNLMTGIFKARRDSGHVDSLLGLEIGYLSRLVDECCVYYVKGEGCHRTEWHAGLAHYIIRQQLKCGHDFEGRKGFEVSASQSIDYLLNQLGGTPTFLIDMIQKLIISWRCPSCPA
jgi:hypothetical protein